MSRCRKQQRLQVVLRCLLSMNGCIIKNLPLALDYHLRMSHAMPSFFSLFISFRTISASLLALLQLDWGVHQGMQGAALISEGQPKLFINLHFAATVT